MKLSHERGTLQVRIFCPICRKNYWSWLSYVIQMIVDLHPRFCKKSC